MSRFGIKDVEILAKDHLGGKFLKVSSLRLRHRLYRGGWSAPLTREILDRGHAVGVLLYDPELDRIVLVEQFRVGALIAGRNPWLLELPAGVIEEGEEPAEVAAREVQEETGGSVGKLEKICSCILSPGGSSEEVHLYYAEIDSSKIGGIHGLDDEHEDIAVVKMPAAEAFKILDQGYCGNATLVIALQWLKIHRNKCSKGGLVNPI
jgi:ADP-ribose pyrophosphatase